MALISDYYYKEYTTLGAVGQYKYSGLVPRLSPLLFMCNICVSEKVKKGERKPGNEAANTVLKYK